MKKKIAEAVITSILIGISTKLIDWAFEKLKERDKRKQEAKKKKEEKPKEEKSASMMK